MLRMLASGAIVGYQRYISPYKGFSCAYRIHTGRCSCSEFARRLVLRCGPWALLAAMPRQFARCRAAYTALQASLNVETGEENGKGQRRRRGSSVNDSGFISAGLEALDCLPCDSLACDSLPCDALPCDF